MIVVRPTNECCVWDMSSNKRIPKQILVFVFKKFVVIDQWNSKAWVWLLVSLLSHHWDVRMRLSHNDTYRDTFLVAMFRNFIYSIGNKHLRRLERSEYLVSYLKYQ